MGVDFLAVPDEATVEEALRRIRLAENVQPEALLTIHAVDDADRLCGTVTRDRPAARRTGDAAVATSWTAEPVRVTPDTDVVDVTILMADYNLMTVPVVDADNQLLGRDHRRRRPRSHHPRRLETTRTSAPSRAAAAVGSRELHADRRAADFPSEPKG